VSEKQFQIIQAAMRHPLAEAVKIAADADLMTVSEWLRRAAVARLKHQGCCPTSLSGEAHAE
jgi:hypothetical protein